MPSTRDSGGADDEFTARAEAFRRELLAHCYRMTGSVDDAEDLVQETYLRAWKSYDGFEGRASLRTWLYRIATNACLTALQHRERRVLPSGLGAPSDDPYAPPVLGDPGTRWIQPVPDALFTAAPDDPEATVISRDSLRLALIASLQYLPPKQRAVLILRDVLAWPAAEVARSLDTTTPAVKSLLQRARRRIEEVTPSMDDVVEPSHPRARELLRGYLAAFEAADIDAIERLLRADAVLEAVPVRSWYSGKKTCLRYLAHQALGSPGEWRMRPAGLNGEAGFAAWHRTADGSYEAFGVGMITPTATGIARIVVFSDPATVHRLGGLDFARRTAETWPGDSTR
jgi:RNA polymerase sigma-70 factor, ECF subfamily